MNKSRIITWIARIVLFVVILIAGTFAALLAGERPGLALVDLSDAAVETVAPAGGSTLYASVVDGPQQTGLYRSDNNGRTWQPISPGPGVAVKALAVQPGNSAVLYAGSTGGPVISTNNLWRSDDGGQTWRKSLLSLPANPAGIVPDITAMATDPDQPDVLYVGTAGQGIYRFKDSFGYELLGGVSLYDAHVRSLSVGAEGRVYALTNKGLFVSANETWRRLDSVPELPVSMAVSSLWPELMYAGGASGGLYRSNDGGQTWTPVNDGLGQTPGASLRVTALAVDDQDPQRVVVATAYGLGSQIAPAGLYESRSAGNSWTRLTGLDELVTGLSLDRDAINATTASGLVRYGRAVEAPVTARPGLDLQPLAEPTVSQVAIMVLTVLLAGLVLLGRIEWLLRLRQAIRLPG